MSHPYSPLPAMSQLSPCGYGEWDRGTVVQSEVRKGVSEARDGVSASLGSTAVMQLTPERGVSLKEPCNQMPFQRGIDLERTQSH